MGLSIYYVTFVGGLILGLFYPNGSNPQLVGYANASYLSNPHKGQSQTWYLFTYLWQQCYFIEICWTTIYATFSNHFKIILIHEASHECIWLRSVIQHIRE